MYNTVSNPNDTLYVITGCDKAVAWASCSTRARETHRYRVSDPLIAIYRGAKEDCLHCWGRELAYRWSKWPCRYLHIIHSWYQICCERERRHVLQYRPADSGEIPYCVVGTTPVLGRRAQLQTLRETREVTLIGGLYAGAYILV